MQASYLTSIRVHMPIGRLNYAAWQNILKVVGESAPSVDYRRPTCGNLIYKIRHSEIGLIGSNLFGFISGVLYSIDVEEEGRPHVTITAY